MDLNGDAKISIEEFSEVIRSSSPKPVTALEQELEGRAHSREPKALDNASPLRKNVRSKSSYGSV